MITESTDFWLSPTPPAPPAEGNRMSFSSCTSSLCTKNLSIQGDVPTAVCSLTPRVYLATFYKCRTLYFRTASMTHVNLFPRSVLLRDSTSPPRVRTLGLKSGNVVCLPAVDRAWMSRTGYLAQGRGWRTGAQSTGWRLALPVAPHSLI